jgi:hypothetical protein
VHSFPQDLCELSYIYSGIFQFENVLSTSLNIFRICEPVLASEHAMKQYLMDSAAPKFGCAHGHMHEIGHLDLTLVDSVKISLQSKSICLWKSLGMAKLPLTVSPGSSGIWNHC